MDARWKKNLLFIWLVIATLVSMAMLNVPVATAAPTARLSAPVIVDETLTPGSTFHINITIADITAMWGYSPVLYYNTTVLTATSYSSYDPFTEEWQSLINDTGGYVTVAYSMELGEEVGFSTVDPAPIARIDFTVDASGTSRLTFVPTAAREELSDIDGQTIPYEEFHGFFANVPVPLHDIAVTNIELSDTTVSAGDEITASVTVENQGDYDETFNVTVKYDDTEIETKTDVTLSTGTSTTLTFTWSTTDVAKGTYRITAEVPPIESTDPSVLDELDLADNKFISDEITVTTKGEQQPDFVLYIGAGAAIVVVAIILVYILRKRKT